jgi:hypothetical protein
LPPVVPALLVEVVTPFMLVALLDARVQDGQSIEVKGAGTASPAVMASISKSLRRRSAEAPGANDSATAA